MVGQLVGPILSPLHGGDPPPLQPTENNLLGRGIYHHGGPTGGRYLVLPQCLLGLPQFAPQGLGWEGEEMFLVVG